jgi:cyclase
MKRLFMAGALVAGMMTPALEAQDTAPDFSSLEVHSLHVQGNVWMLVAGPFNAAVSVGNDGVLVVDTMVAPLADKFLAEVKKLAGDKPIRYIVNTHFHPDHTGGNAKVVAAGQSIVAGNFAAQVGPDAANQANVVAHENAQIRMGELQPPLPFIAMPTSAFPTARKDLFFNGEAVQILHQRAAHTDGDVIVFFRKSDVIVAGDIYINTTFPIVRTPQGGSVQGVIDALNRIIELTVPAEKQEGGTYVIPGHGRLADEADVVEYRDMITIIRDRFGDAIRKGMSLQQIKAARILNDYDGRYGDSTGFWTTDMFMDAVYRSLSEPATKTSQSR